MPRVFLAILFTLMIGACASSQSPDKYGYIEKTPDEILRENVDYLTYLKLKKGTTPLDQDYIVLSYRLIDNMIRADIFSKAEERPRVALRDVLNYNPNARFIRPAVIHEAVEHGLMNTRVMWTTDGSEPYDYVLDVELSEIDIDDPKAENKGLGMMFVLFDVAGKQVGEYFGVMKKDKGGMNWY